MVASPSVADVEGTVSISCCICAREVPPSESVVEERPTGESWVLEDWYYCVDCWLGMRKLRRKKINPDVLLSVLEL